MKMLALGLVAAVAVALAGDAALAQARDGGRVGGQGSYADVRGGPATGGEYRGVPSGGYHRDGYPVGAHAGSSARWYGGYGGWYGPGVGIYFGGPAHWGGWPYSIYGAYPRYYPYSYAYPYPLYVPAEPTVYVEQSPQAVPAGKSTIRLEFAYDGGGLGKGGLGTLYVNDTKVAVGRIERTQPIIFSADETADVGMDDATPVTEDYKAYENAFTPPAKGRKEVPAMMAKALKFFKFTPSLSKFCQAPSNIFLF